MTAAIALALGAMLFNGLMDFTFKQAAAGDMRGDFRMHQFIVAQSALFFTCVLTYGLVTGDLKPGWHVLLGCAAGVFMFAGFNCFAWSLRHGNVSINAPIFRLNFLVTAALAMVLLGEPPVPVKLAGLALALVAIWLLVASDSGGRVPRSREARWSLILAITATLSLGIGNTIHKVGLSVGGTPATQLAAHSLTYLSLSMLVAVGTDRGLKLPPAVWPVAIGGAVFGAGGFIMMMRGLTLGDASVIVPIAQMGLVVTAALGVAVLGERLTARKSIGLVAALGALWTLASS